MADVYDTTNTSVHRSTAAPVIHWPSIIAGAFVALTLFIVLAILGAALSLDGSHRADAANNASGTGAAIWACITAVICFGVGGYVAARTSAAYGRSSARLNGAMVWAVVVPIMVYGLGSAISPYVSVRSSALNDDRAVHASARMDANGGMTTSGITGSRNTENGNANANASDYASQARSAAWWTLISLGIGLAAATAMSGWATDDRRRRSMTTTTTMP